MHIWLFKNVYTYIKGKIMAYQPLSFSPFIKTLIIYVAGLLYYKLLHNKFNRSETHHLMSKICLQIALTEKYSK